MKIKKVTKKMIENLNGSCKIFIDNFNLIMTSDFSLFPGRNKLMFSLIGVMYAI